MSLESALSRLRLIKTQPNTDLVVLRERSEIIRDFQVRNGNPEEYSIEDSTGAMVEVFVNGHYGYSGTANFRPDALQRAYHRAYANAKMAAQIKSVFAYSPKEIRPSWKASDLPAAANCRQLSPEAILTRLLELEVILKKHPRIAHATTGFSEVIVHNRIVSTDGMELESEHRLHSTLMSVTAENDVDSQSRSNGSPRGHCLKNGLEYFLSKDRNADAEWIREEAIELLRAPSLPETVAPLLLMPNQMMLQIHESIGHPLEIDRILGDELNYAGTSFVKLEDFGNLKYGSPLLNVYFDPTLADEFASYTFDDIGAKAEKTLLIEAGILKEGLGSLESKSRIKGKGFEHKSVANQRVSSWNRPPIDRMANLNVAAGPHSQSELYAKTEGGFAFYTNQSWSIDDKRDKFQFGCEIAREVKGGKPGKAFKHPNYRGRTVAFWNSLVGVGNDAIFEVHGTPNCGKGEPNQTIRVGHASPPCVFEKIEVFGGAQ